MAENKQINLEKPVTLVIEPGHLNVILRALELMPLGQARATFQEIEKQVLAQVATSVPKRAK